MTLMLPLLAVFVQATLSATPQVADRPSPPNPMAGVAPESVESVLVRRLIVGFHSVESEDCTIGRDGAQALAAAVARATPRPSQRGTNAAGLVLWIRFKDGRSIGVIGGGAEIHRHRHATFMIEGRNYAFDKASLRAMDSAMMRCDGYHLSKP